MRAASGDSIAVNHVAALKDCERRNPCPHINDGAAQIHFIFDEAG